MSIPLSDRKHQEAGPVYHPLPLLTLGGCGGCGFPGGPSGKEPVCQCKRRQRCGLNLWVGKILWGRKWQPTPEFLLGKFHGQRILVGYSPWGSQRVGHNEACSHCTGGSYLGTEWTSLWEARRLASQTLALEKTVSEKWWEGPCLAAGASQTRIGGAGCISAVIPSVLPPLE